MPDALFGAKTNDTGQSHPNAAPVRINGADLWADPSGALWWPDRRLLAVADLHLEKGSCYATQGRMLPPYDTTATLTRLAETIGRVKPDCVICLGDNFHDIAGPERLPAQDASHLRDLVATVRWIWIAGNHDPSPPDTLGGEAHFELTCGPLVFRHVPLGTAVGEVAGHLHPKLRVALRSRMLAGRCFVSDGRRVILPAFGAFTGGLDAGAPAIRGLMQGVATAHVLVRNRVLSVPLKR